jgi:hypothetical protein
VRRENIYLRIGWLCLLLVGIGILAFGLVAAAVPASGDQQLLRADGLASIGLEFLTKSYDVAVRDDAGREGEEGFVNVVTAFPADA